MAASTARKIIVAARRLLEREGAEAVTMRRVADAVGITAMAIYRHYPDRAALLDAVADQGFEELAAKPAGKRMPAGVEPRLFKMAEIYLDHALAHPRLFELMFLAPRRGARRFPRDFKAGHSPTANPFVAVVAHGMETGYLRDDDPWEITFEMGALIQGLIMLYLGGRIEGSAARFRALSRRSLRRYLHGICR
ncbi:MAG TPA: TetR/AcrR family transcriptional regulator [Kofleriaceae bacterium]